MPLTSDSHATHIVIQCFIWPEIRMLLFLFTVGGVIHPATPLPVEHPVGMLVLGEITNVLHEVKIQNNPVKTLT